MIVTRIAIIVCECHIVKIEYVCTNIFSLHQHSESSLRSNINFGVSNQVRYETVKIDIYFPSRSIYYSLTNINFQ